MGCSDDGHRWECPTFVQDPCSQTPCPEVRCAAPTGCYNRRNDKALTQCLDCSHFDVVCPRDACGANCTLPGQICAAADGTFDNSGAATVASPVCRCVPGFTRRHGCRSYTCKQDGSGFESAVVDAAACCDPTTFAPTRSMCGNICSCSSDGVVRCTQRPC